MILVLLVEDSPTDADLICQVFRRASQEDWQIVYVERLCQAIEICCEDSIQEQPKFDVVLLDLQLPDSTGLTTLETFRQAVPNIPVVVLTGLNNEEVGLQAMEKGAQDYLVKDEINIQRLMRALRYAIERGQILNQLRESEENARAALLKEQELNQLKSEFVAMVSHEFRNPMSTIRTAVDLLQSYSDQISEERKTKYFQRMDNAINQMLQLLNEILFLSQSEADKVSFNPTSIDLENLCREIVDGMQFSIGDQNKIIFAPSGECFQAQMDEELLNCIFPNLLSNAIKYSPKNRDIRFHLNCQDGMAIFEIQDQGIGIPEKDQCHLFETFYRASNTSKIQGTGLGLAIVKRCVELHQGNIKVTSELNVGTTVIVTLPLRNSRSK
jgi:signal transduction histidine kinase